MEARGYRQKDLAAAIASQPQALEVLRRQRPLTLPTIRALSAKSKNPSRGARAPYPFVDAVIVREDIGCEQPPWPETCPC